MSGITLKSIPEDLLASLKSRAAGNHRSLSGEILIRLRKSLEAEAEGGRLRDEAALQADAWERIGGRWVSDEAMEDEVNALYAERSIGRDADVSW